MIDAQRSRLLQDSAVVIGASTSLSGGLFTEIARELRENVGVELDNCRHDLVLMALARRLRARRCDGLRDYAKLIGEDAVEPRRLARALLPSDGDYFLDDDAAAVLSLRLAATLTQHERPQLWVVECGEGDEVYALALRIHHLLTSLDGALEFVVHGSEVDAGAITLAHAGTLAPAFASRIPEALKRDFIAALPYGAQVQPELARHCRFHEAVLMAPPPVAAVDAISGRNILRFLSKDERRLLLQHWHAALKPGGLLLLGPGETVDGDGDLFEPRPLAPGTYLRRAERSWSEPATPVPAVTTAATEIDISVYRSAFASSMRPSALLDPQGRLLDINIAFASLLQADARDLTGQLVQELFSLNERDQLFAALNLGDETRRGGSTTMEARLLRPDGSLPVPVRLHLHVHQGQSIRAHLELELLEGNSRNLQRNPQGVGLNAALEMMNEGLVLIDHAGRIQLMNTVAQRLTGWQPDEAHGRQANEVFRLISPIGEAIVSPIDDCLRNGSTTVMSGQQTQLLSRDGRRLAVEMRISPVPMADGHTGVVMLFEDVSQRLLLADELAWRSSHDAVTGLLNRDEFELQVRAALSRARSHGEPAVVCLIDIDQFRLVNDVLGHSVGDEMLHELSGEMRVRLRERDVLARLSGDEFGVLMPGCRLEDVEASVQGLLEAARRYRFHWLDRKHSVTLSIGVAQVDATTENVGRVLSLADAACHAAKQAGRDRARFMGRDDEAYLHHNEMGLVGQVGRAIEDGRLFLFCEDVVRVDAPDQVVYREILVRMRGEDGNLVKPAHFVPAAERYFLMSALDRWVAREAFAKLATLAADAHRGIVYAVNISGQSISDPEFLDYIVAEIKRSGVDPKRLCFELTETAAVSRLSDAARFVTKLTELGCRFALDDFGVGMSSFGYLKNFPVHFLKIDGSFVRSMQDSQIDRGMVETINRIGHQLGLKTIAEHVESLELLEPLRLMGVDWAQGHGLTSGRSLDDILK
ncbi:MAG: EAL domain-containing protein [Pseudomonadota bacterium]